MHQQAELDLLGVGLQVTEGSLAWNEQSSREQVRPEGCFVILFIGNLLDDANAEATADRASIVGGQLIDVVSQDAVDDMLGVGLENLAVQAGVLRGLLPFANQGVVDLVEVSFRVAVQAWEVQRTEQLPPACGSVLEGVASFLADLHHQTFVLGAALAAILLEQRFVYRAAVLLHLHDGRDDGVFKCLDLAEALLV